jgi:hypothetical protein
MMMMRGIASREAARRARLLIPVEMYFSPNKERDVTRQKRLVEECLDNVCARGAARVGAARVALEEVPPEGDPCVRCDAAVLAPLGGG